MWNIVKYWVDSKTRKKIDIYWGKGRQELNKYIDKDKIFVEFGGTCDDQILDNRGPWDFQL